MLSTFFWGKCSVSACFVYFSVRFWVLANRDILHIAVIRPVVIVPKPGYRFLIILGNAWILYVVCGSIDQFMQHFKVEWASVYTTFFSICFCFIFSGLSCSFLILLDFLFSVISVSAAFVISSSEYHEQPKHTAACCLSKIFHIVHLWSIIFLWS